MEGTVTEDAGASIRDGIKSVGAQGACPESEWPYNPRKFAVKPPKQCYADALKAKAIHYSSVPQDLNSIKAALASGRGVVLGISVYESFESDAVAKTGLVPMPQADESLRGALRAVGRLQRQRRQGHSGAAFHWGQLVGRGLGTRRLLRHSLRIYHQPEPVGRPLGGDSSVLKGRHRFTGRDGERARRVSSALPGVASVRLGDNFIEETQHG